MTIGKIRKEIEARIEKLECDYVNVWHKCADINELNYRQKKIKKEKEKLERALEVLK